MASEHGHANALDDMLYRVRVAEGKLWELSVQDGDALLPPALLQAAVASRPTSERSPRQLRPVPPASGSPRSMSKRAAHAQAAHRLQHPEGHAAALMAITHGLSPRSLRPPASAGLRSGPAASPIEALMLGPSLEDEFAARLPTPAGPLVSRKPASRTETMLLAEAHDRRLDVDGDGLSAWDATFGELVRQVGAQCAERGQLLGRVRTWMLQHIWSLERRVAALERQLVELGEGQGLADGQAEGRKEPSQLHLHLHMNQPKNGADAGADAPRRWSNRNVLAMAASAAEAEAEVAATAAASGASRWSKVSLSKVLTSGRDDADEQAQSFNGGGGSGGGRGGGGGGGGGDSSKWANVSLNKVSSMKQRRSSAAGGSLRRGTVVAQEAAAEMVKKLRLDDIVAWFEMQDLPVQVETLERLSTASIHPESTELLEELILGLLRGADKPGKEAMLLAALRRQSGADLAGLLREHLNNTEGAEALAQQLAASLIEDSMSEASRTSVEKGGREGRRARGGAGDGGPPRRVAWLAR